MTTQDEYLRQLKTLFSDEDADEIMRKRKSSKLASIFELESGIPIFPKYPRLDARNAEQIVQRYVDYYKQIDSIKEDEHD